MKAFAVLALVACSGLCFAPQREATLIERIDSMLAILERKNDQMDQAVRSEDRTRIEASFRIDDEYVDTYYTLRTDLLEAQKSARSTTTAMNYYKNESLSRFNIADDALEVGDMALDTARRAWHSQKEQPSKDYTAWFGASDSLRVAFNQLNKAWRTTK